MARRAIRPLLTMIAIRKDDDSSKEASDDDTKPSANESVTASAAASGSTQSQTFLSQMDVILHEVPVSAVRALFSATVTPMVRSLSESILRNPVDVTIAARDDKAVPIPILSKSSCLLEEKKASYLAMRQLVQRGQLRPPAIVFVQSQERAQALFGELLYDGIHVDVIHAGGRELLEIMQFPNLDGAILGS